MFAISWFKTKWPMTPQHLKIKIHFRHCWIKLLGGKFDRSTVCSLSHIGSMTPAGDSNRRISVIEYSKQHLFTWKLHQNKHYSKPFSGKQMWICILKRYMGESAHGVKSVIESTNPTHLRTRQSKAVFGKKKLSGWCCLPLVSFVANPSLLF